MVASFHITESDRLHAHGTTDACHLSHLDVAVDCSDVRLVAILLPVMKRRCVVSNVQGTSEVNARGNSNLEVRVQIPDLHVRHRWPIFASWANFDTRIVNEMAHAVKMAMCAGSCQMA